MIVVVVVTCLMLSLQQESEIDTTNKGSVSRYDARFVFVCARKRDREK